LNNFNGVNVYYIITQTEFYKDMGVKLFLLIKNSFFADEKYNIN